MFVLDPMLATGGLLVHCCGLLPRAAPPRSPCSARRPHPRASSGWKSGPPLRVFTASVDEGLNDKAYIVPGWVTRATSSSARSGPCASACSAPASGRGGARRGARLPSFRRARRRLGRDLAKAKAVGASSTSQGSPTSTSCCRRSTPSPSTSAGRPGVAGRPRGRRLQASAAGEADRAGRRGGPQSRRSALRRRGRSCSSPSAPGGDRDLADPGRAHQLAGGATSWLSSLAGSPFDSSPWRKEHGALWDIGPHALSILVPLLGPVVAVQAGAWAARHRAPRADPRVGVASTVTLSHTVAPLSTGIEFFVHGDAGRRAAARVRQRGGCGSAWP